MGGSGSKKTAQSTITNFGGQAENRMNNTWDQVAPQSQYIWNNYQNAVDRNLGNYDELMQNYRDFQGKANDWEKTGGYSSGDLSNVRARAVAPIRGIYRNAEGELDRAKNVSGGSMANYGALKAKTARNLSQETSDASTNAEGMIAQMINQGKQTGLQALLQGNNAASGLYGSTPGQVSTFGNQSNQAMNNWLQSQGLQNEMSRDRILQQISQGGMKGVNWDAIVKGVGTGAAIAAMASSRELKHDIEEISSEELLEKFKKLKIYNWKYKDDLTNVTHLGPMAEEFKEVFGVGDGKTLALVDVIGVLLAANKAMLIERNAS